MWGGGGGGGLEGGRRKGRGRGGGWGGGGKWPEDPAVRLFWGSLPDLNVVRSAWTGHSDNLAGQAHLSNGRRSCHWDHRWTDHPHELRKIPCRSLLQSPIWHGLPETLGMRHQQKETRSIGRGWTRQRGGSCEEPGPEKGHHQLCHRPHEPSWLLHCNLLLMTHRGRCSAGLLSSQKLLRQPLQHAVVHLFASSVQDGAHSQARLSSEERLAQQLGWLLSMQSQARRQQASFRACLACSKLLWACQAR